jgi:hypothetical protein
VVDVAHGLARPVAVKIARQYSTKYGPGFDYRPAAEQYQQGPLFRARPTKIIAFDVKRFSSSATRFTFDGHPPRGEAAH